MALTLTDIRHLFDTYGAIAYSGEPVTQLQHALQTAALAEEAGAAGKRIDREREHAREHGRKAEDIEERL